MFDTLYNYFLALSPEYQALVAGCFTWAMTAMGAALVFLFSDIKRKAMDMMLGFAGGVMLAAAFFSLLLPSVEMSEELPTPVWIPPVVGFLLGGAFLYALDRIIPHLHPNMTDGTPEGVPSSFKRTTLLIMAITLHNIPEGLAIGVAFGAVGAGFEGATIPAAIALAVGIGIQNFPEGTAVSTPLRALGMKRGKSFFYGQLSAIVEPISAVIGAAAVLAFKPILPYILAFAAGAMVYVVVEEVIPETQRDKYADVAVVSLMVGFAVMMMLDVSF